MLDAMNVGQAARYSRVLFIVLATLTSFWAMLSYQGSGYVYLLFSLVANALFYFGFRSRAMFFDAFIGVFFWMGFWLKVTIRILFFDGEFSEAVGDFDYTGGSYDIALLVSACGLLGLLLASILREKFFFNYVAKASEQNEIAISHFYARYRKIILFVFFCAFTSVALLNISFGIYQKGSITQTLLPFGLNGVFKWLLLFGLASFSALILKLELVAKKQIAFIVILIVLLESFSTNTSLLSRGMVLNVGALVYGVYVACRFDLLRLNLRTVVVGGVLFCTLFAGSVFVVNDLRGNGPGVIGAARGGQALDVDDVDLVVQHATPLFLNRWVGIEGVMAVSSSPRLGWGIWRAAWQEKYSENTMSFYDANLIESPYKETDFSKYHHLSLPGIIAFFFYPGSLLFLFVSMLLLGLFAAAIEFGVFRWGGKNMILCALMAEVVAYRYASFGYVPAQSYLLFGAIFLNILLLYCIYRLAPFFASKRQIGE